MKRLTLRQWAESIGLDLRKAQRLAKQGRIAGCKLVPGPTPYYSVPMDAEVPAKLRTGPKPKTKPKTSQ